MSKFIIYLALILISTLAQDYTVEEGVIVLTDSTFDKALPEFEFALVEFYAPWCGHCKKLAPEYASAAQQLANSHPAIKLVKIDVTVEKKLAARFRIQGYPSLKFFMKGSSQPIDYDGGRTAKDIVSWLVKRTGPLSTTVNSLPEIQKLIADKELVAVFFGGEDSRLWSDYRIVAASFDDIVFLNTKSDEIRQHYKVERDNLVLFKKFDEGRNTFSGAWSIEAVKKFLKTNKFPLITYYDQKASQRIFGERQTALFLLVDDNEAGRKAEAAFRAAGEHLKGKIILSIAKANDPVGKTVFEHVGITAAQAPTLRIVITVKSMNKYSFEGEITKEAVITFYEDYSKGKLKPFFKSDPIPEKNDEPVKVLVGKNFRDIVINSEDDVLVEFYAPWCGHCKKLAPIYESLAKRLSKVSNLVIAKMDATANEVEGVTVKSYPTIKLFARGRKFNPINFDGERTEEGIIEFLKKNSKVNLEEAGARRDNEL